MSILFEEGLFFSEERLKTAVESDFSNATDVADYLVVKGIPFREAYQMVGGVVKNCLERGILLKDVELQEWQEIYPGIDQDLYEVLSPKQVVASRLSEGGTGFLRVEEQLRHWRSALGSKKK